MAEILSEAWPRSGRCRRLRRTAALLMTAASLPGAALAAEAAAQSTSGSVDEEILVVGERLFVDIQPERELDRDGIDSYGQSTIDELLAEVRGELGDGEEPLILVNGERVGDLGDIGGLPVEALDNVRILPRGSAVRAGGSTGQRVVNLTLVKKMRSATVLVAPRVSTDGNWGALRGDAILTYINGSTRANLTFRARRESDLLESERDIVQPEPSPAFAIGGNVVGFPDTQGEIDPWLSAAAGETVFVAPIPDGTSPTLLDFVPNANMAATTDIGDFRTLRPKAANYDLNGAIATRLTPWLTGNVGLRFSHATRRALRGLPSALFLLSPTNATSPFSTTVAIAEYGRRPLATRSERDSREVNLALNARFGQWSAFFSARHARSEDVTRTQRRASAGAIALADSIDAFGMDLFDLVEINTARSESRSTLSNARLSATGPLVTLPAGPLQATVEGVFAHNRLRSESDFSLAGQKRTFRRTETGLRGAIDAPLTSRDGFGGALGDLNATAEFSRLHYSDAKSVSNHAFGLAWEPHPVLRLSADIEETRNPASVQLLGNPVIETSAVRTFDPLTGETVDVTQITGGNPDLSSEKTTIRRLSASARLVERLNLRLHAEYTDTKERNFVSLLPEASAAVMLAFPERFIRDLDGTLTTVDLRPVNFDERREKRFRYGISLSTKLGSGAATLPVRTVGEPDSDSDDAGGGDAAPMAASARQRRWPATRISVTASHAIVFDDEIVIRSGLPSVDLLDGGAIGIGGGRVRHQLDGTASITSAGTGLRISARWRGKSKLNALDAGMADSLVFSPVFILNLRAFADLHRFLPHSEWARGARLSLNVVNATNDRQDVRNSANDTPLRYQAGYRDALGRTIELELRKVF